MTSPGSGSSDVIRGDMNFCDKKHFINKGMATHLGDTAECSSHKSLKASTVIFYLLLNTKSILNTHKLSNLSCIM